MKKPPVIKVTHNIPQTPSIILKVNYIKGLIKRDRPSPNVKKYRKFSKIKIQKRILNLRNINLETRALQAGSMNLISTNVFLVFQNIKMGQNLPRGFFHLLQYFGSSKKLRVRKKSRIPYFQALVLNLEYFTHLKIDTGVEPLLPKFRHHNTQTGHGVQTRCVERLFSGEHFPELNIVDVKRNRPHHLKHPGEQNSIGRLN